ncbi:hypothetical protein AB3N59_05380 [Leptospira sp. WS92.C1]
MSRSSRKNPASFYSGFVNDCLMQAMRILVSAIFILSFFPFCVPADPEYRQKVLENVKDTGFISREFFQILVKVPLPIKDAGIQELRNQCRKIAETKRDEIAVAILLTEIRENNRLFDRLKADPGKYTGPTLPPQVSSVVAGIATTTAPGAAALSTGNMTTTPQTANPYSANTGTATSTSESLIPDPKAIQKEKEKAKRLNQDALIYRGAFTWFLNSLFLFREDYTDPSNCTFIYRNIQKDLYANVIRKGIQPIAKQEVPEAP